MALNGIDISGWQPGIDLAVVPADFVIIKATGGVSFVSAECDPQFQQAKTLGRLKGVYHFAREAGYRGTAEQEADHFINSTKGYQDGQTMLVLDWEGDNTWDVGWALAWLQRVEKATGIKPVIYMSTSVANAHDWSPVAAAGYGLWAAAYVLGYQPINGYSVPSGLATIPHWDVLAMWQYTSSGKLPGWSGALDLNVFYGDRTAWLKYCAKAGTVIKPEGEVTKPAPPAPKPPAPAPAPAPSGTYTVRAGDNLSAIAAQFGTSWQSLAALNGLTDPDVIHPGQVLKVTGNAPAPAPAPGVPPYCIVESGDNLTAIAAQFGVSLAQILRANPGINPDLIYPGQRINLR